MCQYHTIVDTDSDVALIWWCNLQEGKDRPPQLRLMKCYEIGKTVGLILCMMETIHQMGKTVTMDSGLCVSQGIVEMHKRGMYSQALIKKMWSKLAKRSTR